MMQQRAVIGLMAIAIGLTTVPEAMAQSGKGPTLVKDVENPAHTAVSGRCYVEWFTSNGTSSCELFMVPQNATLVIEHASAGCLTEGTDRIGLVGLRTNLPGQPDHFTPLVLASQPEIGGQNNSVVSQPVRVYSRPGQPVWGTAWFDGNPADSIQFCDLAISGHIVNTQ